MLTVTLMTQFLELTIKVNSCRFASSLLSEQLFSFYHCQAQEAIQRATISSEYEYIDQVHDGNFDLSKNMSPFLSSTYRPCIPQSKFDVSTF